MDLEQLVTGVKKANLNELKELKVKLPVRLLVNLHYVKLTQSRGISDVVNEALTQYFADFAGARAKTAPDSAKEGAMLLVHAADISTATTAPTLIQP